ncbi:hypothetical protein Tsubulata_038499 [Turnera subulata]|uniref:Uncharacterized protein n=1 Tax=Turnera subulata TaxID=218843 RepID=A0A9Q0JA26_9ROSI|nr:hypothetical protein Tsubulata_038499 [Turnera subulata]
MSIRLKAVMDEANNRVLFVESDHELIDHLLSFLTIPMGEVIRLIRGSHPPKTGIGCMDNLYHSVENPALTRSISVQGRAKPCYYNLTTARRLIAQA